MKTVKNEIELISHIFGVLHFPFLAADLRAVNNALKAQDAITTIQVDLSSISNKRDEFAAALKGLFGSIDVPESVAHILSESPILTADRPPREAFKYLHGEATAFSIRSAETVLAWSEHTLWPTAYKRFVNQLLGVFQREMHFAQAVCAQTKEAGISTILDHSTRAMPTRYHRAFASLGGWVGGCGHIAFFSQYGTSPQLTETGKNQEYALLMNYSQEDAAAIDESQIVAVPASITLPLFKIQGSNAFGVSGINEVNAVNLPKNLKQVTETHLEHPGFLMDSQYAATWTAKPLDEYGLYGEKDVFRDHYKNFYGTIAESSRIRCKHYTAPVIDVSSAEELREIAQAIDVHSDEGVFFRGQSRLYLLNRRERIKKMLFGNSCSLEPSLPNSSDRDKVFYEPLHYALRFYLQNYVFCETGSYDDDYYSPDLEFDYAVMALAQHYGLPSPGLDVTSDLDVATWFASNKFSQNPDTGTATYRSLEKEDFDLDPAKWPVVLAFQNVTHSLSGSLQTCESLSSKGLGTLRPERQSGSFFLGSHSEHRNRLTEAVVCAFRLRPNRYETGCDFSSLFPSVEEDDAYRVMLEFEKFVEKQGAEPHRVTRFHRAIDL